MPKKNSIRPKDEIAEMVEAYIEENELKENEKLPSERFLCEKWGINRTTLRNALARLIKEGVVYSVRGIGYFVAEKKLIRNLQDLRPLVEIVKEQGKELTTVVLSSHLVEADESIAKRLEIQIGEKVMELIRLRYLNGTPSLLEYSYINQSFTKGIEDCDFNTNSLYDTLERVYQIKPSAGSQKVSISYATDNESKLLQIPEGTPIFFLRGVTYSEGEQHPFEYFKSIIRSDNVKFFSTLRRKEEF
ncbi:GntR family transcriptional regulator [Neobacillus sp. OS1-32]|uniref:GntR family transcriptional regulator n=1 Tax=Neobacillus sp. OS1-32 TaxID=3070682 RepID=UPI0027E0F1CE|nr:GntR family transcriptional regulator [Neobacillus sp. OS1-32]WML32206.1 GntR family transcriptional regulator [Neobacillus sp. OS1-32]